MKKKKSNYQLPEGLDPEVLKMYLTGATNPGSGIQRKYSADVVDLHFDQEAIKKKNINPADALLHQINDCEKALDQAIAAGKMEIRLIHGLGTGKLKTAITDLLKKHPQVSHYEQKYHSQYGEGSTLIFFK